MSPIGNLTADILSEKKIRRHGTTQMRCLQLQEYLNRLDRPAKVGSIYTRPPFPAKYYILHRIRLDRVTNAAMDFMQSVGGVLLYDTDDMIFVDEAVGRQAASSRRAAMARCDGVIVSTDYLAEQARIFHPYVRVLRNALSGKFLESAGKVYRDRQSRNPKSPLTIGYCSGSSQHDDDLNFILPAITRLLDKNPGLVFRLVGKIWKPEALDRFGSRVVHTPFIPYERFPEIYTEIDINLAPLDSANIKTLGRSEIKYMEAGACGVPTIASPNSAYSYAIRPGENGWLAGVDEWPELLEQVVANPDLREQVGHNARTDVLRAYHPDTRSKDWSDFLQGLMQTHELKNGQLKAGYARIGTKARLIFLQRFRLLRRAAGAALRPGR